MSPTVATRPTAAELMTRALEKYNPLQPRDADGQWSDGVPGFASALDKLKLASRIDLKPGESLLSSQRIRTKADADGWDLMTAEVDTPNGRQVRLGIIHPNDSKHWTGGRDPNRAQRIAELNAQMERMEVLDEDDSDRFEELQTERDELLEFDRGNVNRTAFVAPADISRMRNEIEAGIERAKEFSKAWRKLAANDDTTESQWDALGDNDQYFLEGSIPGGPEGDLHYLVGGSDDGEGGWKIDLGIKPPDAEENWYIGYHDDRALFEGGDVKKLLAALDGLTAARSSESFHRYNPGVRSMPDVRSLEAFAVLSPSPAVRLMMWARTLEASDTFKRRGRLVTVERGRGGRFGKGIGGAIADAVGDAVRAATPEAPKPMSDRVTDTYRELRNRYDNDWVALSQLRPALGGTREEQDSALTQLLKDGKIRLIPEENQQSLTAADRDAAIGVSGEGKHLIGFKDALQGRLPAPEAGAPKKPRAPRNAVAKALASGNPSALSGFDREPLRREAGRRGLNVPHGAHVDVIRDMLWDDENSTSGRTGTSEPMAQVDSDDLADATLAVSNRREDLRQRIDAEEKAIQSQPRPGSVDRTHVDRMRVELDQTRAEHERLAASLLQQRGDSATAAKPSRSRARKAPADTDSIADRIRSLPRKPESRAALAAELDSLGAADMRAVADKWDIPLPKRTTKAQSRKAIEDRLDFLIDHDSVRNSGSGDNRPPADEIEAKNYFAEFAARNKANQAADRERLAGRTPQTSALDTLRNATSEDRQKVVELLNGMSDAELTDAASKLSTVPIRGKQSSRQRQIDDIIEGTVGFRERAGAVGGWGHSGGPIALRGETPSPTRTKRARALKSTMSDEEARRRAHAISGGEDIWAKLRQAHRDEGDAAPLESSRPAKPFKPVRRPKQPSQQAKTDVPSAVDSLRPMVDNPGRSLPSSGHQWNWETIQEDNMTMHGDSASMELAQKLRKAGRAEDAQYVADMRYRISNNRGEHSPDDVEKMVADLKAMMEREPDPQLRGAYQTALRDIDAPAMPMPVLPNSTPPVLRRMLDELNKIPNARRTGRFAGTHKDVSVVDRLAGIIRQVDAGDREALRGWQMQMRDALRSLHESVDGAMQMWRLEKLLDDPEIRSWVRSNYPKT